MRSLVLLEPACFDLARGTARGRGARRATWPRRSPPPRTRRCRRGTSSPSSPPAWASRRPRRGPRPGGERRPAAAAPAPVGRGPATPTRCRAVPRGHGRLRARCTRRRPRRSSAGCRPPDAGRGRPPRAGRPAGDGVAAGGLGAVAPVGRRRGSARRAGGAVARAAHTGPMVDARRWLLTRPERGNPQTRLDDRHPGDRAWSEGNLVTPLIHGAAYFRALYRAIEATGEGDLVLFTDWQGDGDERLTGEPGQRGGRGARPARTSAASDVHGPGVALPPRPDRLLRHREPPPRRAAAAARAPRCCSTCGCAPAARTTRSSWWSGTGTTRARDVAFVGGIDLAHNRRDDADHGGDPQPQPLTEEYGAHPPWHDVQVAIRGPAVHDVETVFRERWDDPAPLSRAPWRRAGRPAPPASTARPTRCPRSGRPRPRPATTSSSCCGPTPTSGSAATTPSPRGGERSVARGYAKAVRAGRAARLRRGPVLLGARRRSRLRGAAARAARAARWSS